MSNSPARHPGQAASAAQACLAEALAKAEAGAYWKKIKTTGSGLERRSHEIAAACICLVLQWFLALRYAWPG